MKVWILRRLRTEARVWRAQDDQRQSIRRTLDVLRKTIATTGTYVSAGVGGTTIHYARGCTLRATVRWRTSRWRRSSSRSACR